MVRYQPNSGTRTMRLDGVIPARTDWMTVNVQGLKDILCDPDTFLVLLRIQPGIDRQAGLSGRIANPCQHDLEGAQGFSSPIEADRAEQAVFHRVPLGSTGRVMTDGDFQPQTVCQLLLELLFPQARAIAIAASGVCQDQDLGGRWE